MPTDLLALEVLLRAAEVARQDGEADGVGERADVLLGAVDERAG